MAAKQTKKLAQGASIVATECKGTSFATAEKVQIFFDTETGGLEPQKHALLSIGAFCKVGGKIKDAFYLECRPLFGTITEQALAVNRFELAEINKREQTEVQAVESFFWWIFTRWSFYTGQRGKVEFIAQNLRFDWDFLTFERRLKKGLPWPQETVLHTDTRQIIKTWREKNGTGQRGGGLANFLEDCPEIELQAKVLAGAYFPGVGADGHHGAAFDAAACVFIESIGKGA